MAPAHSPLSPSFENAFWRQEESRRFRDFAGFAKKKGHFEPAEHTSAAERWAAELVREEGAEEVRRVYENATVIFGNRRSDMERTDHSLECAQFRFAVHAAQDEEDPARVRVARQLWIKMALNELPEMFDDLFPFRPDELVVPVRGFMEKRAVLLALEGWEHALRARLSENLRQSEFRLRLPSGFGMRVDFSRCEVIFSQENISGVRALGPWLTRELRAFGFRHHLA